MSTNLSQAQSAQQGNRTTDGKYTFGTHAEPESVGLTASSMPASLGKLHEEFGIGPDHQYLDAFNQMEGLRSASAAILEAHPEATSMKLTQNQDGENQWDLLDVTDASGQSIGDVEDLVEHQVDNRGLGDFAGAIWQLDKGYPITNGAGIVDQGRSNDFATMKVDLQAAANPNISRELLNIPQVPPRPAGYNSPHPEDALSEAGASDGYFEIVGAKLEGNKAQIDLSTVDETGGLLAYDYDTEMASWTWDDPYLGPGSEKDVQTAIEDITRGKLTTKQLFTNFKTQMEATN